MVDLSLFVHKQVVTHPTWSASQDHVGRASPHVTTQHSTTWSPHSLTPRHVLGEAADVVEDVLGFDDALLAGEGARDVVPECAESAEADACALTRRLVLPAQDVVRERRRVRQALQHCKYTIKCLKTESRRTRTHTRHVIEPSDQ